ncbi:hypothetical protein [Streptomyces sp. NPDC090135]|uniref:hypothetical protein n=1 Tax=Streptomyces sp. NPDC090135 TaxID=3365957 RepID=UPI0037F227F0
MSDAMPEPVGEPPADDQVDGRIDEGSGEISGTGETGRTGEPGDAIGEPAAPAPLGVARELTGHSVVDARLARLAEVDALPADGHLEVYEDVHRGLRDELTSLDAAPAPRPYDNRS